MARILFIADRPILGPRLILELRVRSTSATNTWTDCVRRGLPRGNLTLSGQGRGSHTSLQTQPVSIHLNSSVFVISPPLPSNGSTPATLPSHLPPHSLLLHFLLASNTFPGFIKDQSPWQLTVPEFSLQPYEVL